MGVAPTTVSFAAGETNKTVTVTVNGDTTVEPDETLYAKMSSPRRRRVRPQPGPGRHHQRRRLRSGRLRPSPDGSRRPGRHGNGSATTHP
ncbi:MAG: hypothetical protein ACRD12_19535, partial [Acidimicrobiales bacterium]